MFKTGNRIIISNTNRKLNYKNTSKRNISSAVGLVNVQVPCPHFHIYVKLYTSCPCMQMLSLLYAFQFIVSCGVAVK